MIVKYTYGQSMAQGEKSFANGTEAVRWLARQARLATDKNVPLCGTLFGKCWASFSCQYGKAFLVWTSPEGKERSIDLLA